MVDKERKIVHLGDNDVKVSINYKGILFGRCEVPDNPDDIEGSYDFMMELSISIIPMLLSAVNSCINNNIGELEFLGITIVFDNTRTAVAFKHIIAAWVHCLSDAVKNLENLIKEE